MISKQVIVVKVTVSLFVLLGIICGVFCVRSCRWYAFLNEEDTILSPLVENNRTFYNVSIDITKMSNFLVRSIGIFRYEASFGNDRNDTNFPHDGEDRCLPYSTFLVDSDHRWKFIAQIFISLAPIVGFQSLCFMIAGLKRFWVGIFLLAAMGLHMGTAISSLSWCDKYWYCPWMVGAKVNLLAAILFFLGWLFVIFGLNDNEEGNLGDSKGYCCYCCYLTIGRSQDIAIQNKEPSKEKKLRPISSYYYNGDIEDRINAQGNDEISYDENCINNLTNNQRQDESNCSKSFPDDEPNHDEMFIVDGKKGRIINDDKTYRNYENECAEDGDNSSAMEIYENAKFYEVLKACRKKEIEDAGASAISQHRKIFRDLEKKLKERRSYLDSTSSIPCITNVE